MNEKLDTVFAKDNNENILYRTKFLFELGKRAKENNRESSLVFSFLLLKEIEKASNLIEDFDENVFFKGLGKYKFDDVKSLKILNEIKKEIMSKIKNGD